MATDRQLQALEAYREMMREVSQRLWWTERMLAGKSGMSAMLIRDSGFLQVRMICELVAYSCLLVHGDIEETQAPRIQKAYNADTIMKALAKLHPEYFPRAHEKMGVGPNRWHFADGDNRALSQDAFGKLYGRCGDELHRGSLAKIIAERGTKDLDLSPLRDAITALKLTVCCHSIALLNGQTRFIADFTPSIEGDVTTVIGEWERS